MKHENIKKLLCFAVILSVIFCSGNTVFADKGHTDGSHRELASEEISSEGRTYVLQCRNNEFALYLNEDRGDFYVKSVKTENKWSSIPESFFKIEKPKATLKKQALSSICVKILDVSSNDENTTAYSYSDSVMYDGMKTEKTDNGVLISYYFPDYEITVPLEIALTDRGFTASVFSDGIKEEDSDSYRAISVGILPMFNAGTSDESGFLFVPDGSGAVINFNNGKESMAEFSCSVYGRDYSVYAESDNTVEQQIRLPVFASVHTDSYSMSVITSGASVAYIKARSNTSALPFNYVYSSFSLRTKEYLRSNDRWSDTLFYQKDKVKNHTFCIEYILCGEANSDYSDVANKFRDYLIEVFGLSAVNDTAGLELNITGATVKKQLVMGIPFNKAVSLTEYGELEEMLSTLSDAGIEDAVINFEKWSKYTALKSYAHSGGLSLLGGKKRLKALMKTAEEKGYKLFLNTDPIRIYKNKSLFSVFNDYAHTLFNASAELYNYKSNTYAADEEQRVGHLIRKTKLGGSLADWNEITEKYGSYGLGLSGTDTLYTDFRDKAVSRENTLSEIINALENVSKNRSCLIRGGNYYTVAYAEFLSGTPSTASGFDIEDESIPFYQIALHGLVPYSVEAVNAQSDYHDAFLHSVEVGAVLSFELIGNGQDSLRNSEDEQLIYADADYWISEIIEMYDRVKELYKKTAGTAIKSHFSCADGVYVTVYDNGLYTVVNYNSQAVDTVYGKVNAKQFIIGKSEAGTK